MIYSAAPTHRLRSTLPGLILAALCLYFSFYLVFGPRGYLALQRIQETYQARKIEHAELAKTSEKLEAHVKLMRPNSLDPDMAEEQARRVLGYTRPDEIVIDLDKI